MGVAGGNPLHNGAVCDAQIADAVDPQLGGRGCSFVVSPIYLRTFPKKLLLGS